MNTTTKSPSMLALLFLAMLTFFSTATFAAPPETMRIWRVQIQFQTPNVSDAGSDDSVRVRLNGTNSTWLDYGRDDFARNTVQTYDLNLTGLSRLSDLQYIYITKTGSDGWLVKSFSLLVNGRAIYTQTFPGNGRWLDTDSGESPNYFVSSSTLRADDAWVNYAPPLPPFVIPRVEMESRIEGMVGDFIHGNQLEWGHLYGRAVEGTRKNANTLHFDLDLKAAIDYLPDPEVDVDFDVEVTCANGTIAMTVKNVVVDVDSNPILRVLTLNLISFLDNYLSGRINDAVKNIKIGQNVPIGFCPNITIDGNANVIFSLPTNGNIPILTLAEMDRAADDVAISSMEDNAKPLGVSIEAGDAAKAGEDLPYSVRVKSNKPQASGFDVQIELPSSAHLPSAVVEVVDDAGNRSMVGAQAVPENGKTVLRFRDYLNAGAIKTYTTKVQFEQAANATSSIATKVMPLNADETIDATATVDAVTTLKTEGDVTRAKATLKQSTSTRKVDRKLSQD
ncbi:MAG: hypothetical protein JNM09_08680 [Blastocatellia bacterium]|nr:hypothetical protein [Blastocatellia bacterium]